MEIKPRVVLFLTSLFAQNTLAFLAQKQYLVGVILPDPNELGEAGGEVNRIAMQLQQSGIPFQMCCKEKLPLIVEQLDAWNANVGLISTYPHGLPEEIIDYFSGRNRLGIYNIHASQLPKYVGPNPIYWQIRNGEIESGVVIHCAEKVADTGNIVLEKKVPIEALDTLPSLNNRLAYEAYVLVMELMTRLSSSGEKLKGEPQDQNTDTTYAPRLTEKDYIIDFDSMSANEVSAMCRAGNGFPYGAILNINGVSLNLIQATPVARETFGTKPGTVIFIGEPEGLIICVKGGALRLDIISGVDGIYSGLAFAERFSLDAGAVFNASFSLKIHA